MMKRVDKDELLYEEIYNFVERLYKQYDVLDLDISVRTNIEDEDKYKLSISVTRKTNLLLS